MTSTVGISRTTRAWPEATSAISSSYSLTGPPITDANLIFAVSAPHGRSRAREGNKERYKRDMITQPRCCDFRRFHLYSSSQARSRMHQAHLYVPTCSIQAETGHVRAFTAGGRYIGYVNLRFPSRMKYKAARHSLYERNPSPHTKKLPGHEWGWGGCQAWNRDERFSKANPRIPMTVILNTGSTNPSWKTTISLEYPSARVGKTGRFQTTCPTGNCR